MLSASETAQRQAHEYNTLSNRLKSYQRQKDKHILTEEQYNAKVQATQTRLAALTAQTETLTIKQRLLAGVTKTVATAFNMLKMAAVTFAVTGIIALISTAVNHLSDLANNVSKTKEKVKSLTDEFNTAISTANDNAKRIEELIDNYDKLSDGVNNLGENISLTNEEYDEYKSLTNEIADMFPNLIQGYDNEGNAVLNLKGNVEQLRDAYKEAQQEAYNLLIATGKDGDGNDIIKQWQDTQNTNFWAKLFGGDEVGKDISVSEALKLLKTFEEMDIDRFRELPTLVSGAVEEVNGLKPLTDDELDLAYSDFVRKTLGITDWNISEEDFANAKKQANALVQTYNTEIESALSGTRSLANAYLNRNDDFSKLDESSQKAASVIVNSLDADIANQLTTLTAFSTFTDDVVNAFKNEDVQEAANSLFTLDTSSMSVGEINSEIDKYIDIIANAIGEDSDKLKIRLGFDDTNETLERAKAKFKIQANSAMSGLQDGIYDFLENLSLSDLNIAMQIPDLFDDGLLKASEKIKERKQNPDNNPASFDYSTYSEDVDKVAKNIDKVQSTLDKLNSGKTVDNKDITELADAFPEYSTKILAASDDTEKLKAVLTEVKTNAPRSLIDTLSNLKDLSTDDQEAVNGLITILKRCGDTTAEYASTADDVSKKVKLITTAMSDMNENGYISSSTYAELQEMGGNFTECLEVQNGKLVVNIQKLKELEIQEYKNIKARKQALLDAYEKISASREAVGLGTSSISSFIDEQISNLQTEIAGYNTAINEIKTAKPDDKKKEDPASVKQFKKDNEEKKHLLEMEQITEQEYYDWLDSESQRVYGKLADYQDELWKHEEEVYKWRQEQEQKLFDKKIDNLEKLADKALDKNVDSNGNELTVTASFDYAREQINSAIAETQTRIDGIKNGTISGDNDDIEQLTDDLDSLYDKLTDINEKEIDSQKEYIKTLKDEYSDLIDEQIDQQKKLADNIEKAFEKQIDNIDKQIDAINKVNEAEERQKDILEAQEAVKEAQRNLDKASVNNRLVYTGNGGYELRSDKDAVEEAKKNLADKQAELQKAMDEQKIAVLEEQKESLETQKKNSKDYYDKVVDDLEEQKTAREKQYDLLIDIYEQLGGEKKQTSLNDSLVSKLTANGDINKAVQGLTPTEMQKAITSGILTTDSEGNYAIDYSILGENEKAVNDNTAELQKTKSELEKLNNSLNGDTSNTNSSATSKVDTTKPHLDANGYLVDANGKQILNDGKPIHAKNFSEEIATKKTNEKVAKAVGGVGKFAGYETMNDLFKAMSLGEFTIPQPVADSVRNPYLNNRITENLTKAGEQVATNSNVNNNSPVINFTVQVDGSADEKTISKMKTEISNTLVECFNYWGNSMDTAFTRQINKS